MRKRIVLLIALLVAPLLQAQGRAPARNPHTGASDRVGDARAGQSYWQLPNTFCSSCHGSQGEGGYGPDLAGRTISFAQFKRQVRQPWGMMPRWTEQQISDRTLADVYAYLVSLPQVSEPGSRRIAIGPNAPMGRRYFVETAGCAQCHDLEMKAVLQGADGKKDFAWLTKQVYAHADLFPQGAMGAFSRSRLPEVVLRQIWRAANVEADTRPNAPARASVGAKPKSRATLQAQNSAPVGDPKAGKVFWEQTQVYCRRCHGGEAQGGYGPDLAGRTISFAQFKRQVRQPWGVMPRWAEQQVSDQTLADVHAYLMTLPRVETPGTLPPGAPPDPLHLSYRTGSRVTVPLNAPLGQRYFADFGCAECHGPELATARRATGATGETDFQWLSRRVYAHLEVNPDGRMGTFYKTQVPEPLLREIWRFMNQLGLRANVRALLSAGVHSGENVSYTLTVENLGTEKGIKPEDVTVELVLASGTTVVTATGDGYQGIHRDPKSGADIASWNVPIIAPKEKQTYTLVLSGPKAASGIVMIEGVQGVSDAPVAGHDSLVRWSKPALRTAFPDLAVRDARIPDVGDHVGIIKARPRQQTDTQ